MRLLANHQHQNPVPKNLFVEFVPAAHILGKEGTVVATDLKDHPRLPDGTYQFAELYCTDPHCDCRKAIIQVLHNGQPVGPIDFGWESVKFYTKWARGDKELAREMQGWSSNPLARYRLDPADLIELLKEHMHDQWLTAIKSTYQQIRKELKRQHRPAPSPSETKAPSRNSPCPCGSGKKYKRCCLDKDLAEPASADSPDLVPFPGNRIRPPGVQTHPGNADAEQDLFDQVEIALKMLREGHLERGETLLQTLLKKDPEAALVHYGLGVSQVVRQDFERSITHFEKAVEFMPDFVEAWHNLGLSYRNKMNIAAAVNCAWKVVEHGAPGDEMVNESRKFLKHASDVISNDLGLDLDEYLENSLRFERAFRSMQQRDYLKAIDGFKEVFAVEPTSYPALGNLALCHAALGQREKALKCLNQALAINPEYEVATENKPIFEAMTEGEKLDLPIRMVRWGHTGMKPIKPAPRRLTAPSDE